ncbi:Holliday junction branch migration protein RuvA [Halotalea alkalilenta]|uniref:Holliday junction branch migration complex subunit RuvA n=1 Tax=Halotalea alkalilenta TaxID=376489 RepID=A0A172YGQ6_9GAMM|nr:Holliday junction branch migration protein RuvA [Halotalea alkalilenta]ANF58232.1 Holliday junction DNA helicase RuvA [Halotalea alkalilenta]
MIGRLHGILIEKQPPWVVIDVGGVGYELEASMNTILSLPALGEQARLYTHLIVREDAHLLYGFRDELERRMFRELIRIAGVGPRMALAILSGMERGQFVRCLMDEDAQALTRLPGVGKKTAERLIVEMRDRLTRWPELTREAQPDLGALERLLDGEACELHPPGARGNYVDAEAALIALGYKPVEATRMLAELDHSLSTEALIKSALAQRIGSGRTEARR